MRSSQGPQSAEQQDLETPARPTFWFPGLPAPEGSQASAHAESLDAIDVALEVNSIDSSVSLLREALAVSRAETAQLRAEKAALTVSARTAPAARKGGRPALWPDNIDIELAALCADGLRPPEARRALCERYGGTNQGLGQALQRCKVRTKETVFLSSPD